MILVQDQQDCVFGGFLNESFKCKDDYYGSGECKIFKFVKSNKAEVRNFVPKRWLFSGYRAQGV